jgi:hypothetical protein
VVKIGVGQEVMFPAGRDSERYVNLQNRFANCKCLEVLCPEQDNGSLKIRKSRKALGCCLANWFYRSLCMVTASPVDYDQAVTLTNASASRLYHHRCLSSIILESFQVTIVIHSNISSGPKHNGNR